MSDKDAIALIRLGLDTAYEAGEKPFELVKGWTNSQDLAEQIFKELEKL